MTNGHDGDRITNGGKGAASSDDTGSRDRATVALVDAKVDGLRELIRAEFANVKEDVRSLAAVVSDVIKQGIVIDQHERRLQKLEDGNAGAEHERRLQVLEANKNSDRDWRRISLPTLIISGSFAIVGIVGVVTQIH